MAIVKDLYAAIRAGFREWHIRRFKRAHRARISSPF